MMANLPNVYFAGRTVENYRVTEPALLNRGRCECDCIAFGFLRILGLTARCHNSASRLAHVDGALDTASCYLFELGRRYVLCLRAGDNFLHKFCNELVGVLVRLNATRNHRLGTFTAIVSQGMAVDARLLCFTPEGRDVDLSLQATGARLDTGQVAAFELLVLQIKFLRALLLTSPQAPIIFGELVHLRIFFGWAGFALELLDGLLGLLLCLEDDGDQTERGLYLFLIVLPS